MKTQYSIHMYKNEILNYIFENSYDPISVAKYTSKLFFSHQADVDLYVREKMLDVMTMEDGPEFEMTEDQFMEFLDKL